MIYRITNFTRQCIFWFLIFFAIVISFVRFFIVDINRYKVDLEEKIYELTSIPMEIGTIQASIHGLNPEVILKNIKVAAFNNHPISLDEVHLHVDFMQLLLTREILPSSWLTLVGAKLSIIRDKTGNISIAGLGGDDSGEPLWLLDGRQYQVLKSEVTWIDQKNDMPSIVFKNVDLLIKNTDGQHEFHLVSQMPKKYGEKLRVSVEIQGDDLDFEALTGKAYIETNHLYFSKLLTDFLPSSDINVTGGKRGENCNIELWANFQHSTLIDFYSSIYVKNIIFHRPEKTFHVRSLTTDIMGRNQQGDWHISANNLRLATDKMVWPTEKISFSSNKNQTHLTAKVDRLDLTELSDAALFFTPLKQEQKAIIESLNLKGKVDDLYVDIDLKTGISTVIGSFENIFTHAYAGMPQIENLTGSVKGSNSQGVISLDTRQGSLFFPDLLRKPILIDKLTGQIKWQENANEWDIQSSALVFNNQNIQSETKLALTIPKDDRSIFIDLQSTFTNIHDISLARDYYPMGVMSNKTVDWLDKTFVSGGIEKGDLLVYGKLDQFPFIEGQGAFEVLFNLADVELRYAEDWPNLTHVNADVLFFKNSLAVDIHDAEVQRLKIKDAVVKIPSFDTSERLLVTGKLGGAIPDMLEFLQSTPIIKGADAFADAIATKGQTQAKLSLKIPLTDSAVNEVEGIAHFDNATLHVKSIGLDIKRVTGDLKFTEQGLSSNNITAKTLGYPVGIKVGYDSDKTTIKIKGKTDSTQLKKQFSFLDNKLIGTNPKHGSTSYDIVLDLPEAKESDAVLNLESTLAGMPINLPGKLKKIAEEERPLSITMRLNKQDFLPLTIYYNQDLKTTLRINKAQDTITAAHIVYGASGIKIPKEDGMSIHIEQSTLDGFEWSPFIAQSFTDDKDSESGIKLNNLSVKVDTLQWKGKDKGAFEFNLLRSKNKWKGRVLSSITNGDFVVPVNQNEADKIKIELSQLNLSGLMQLHFESDSTSEETMPAIDLVSQQLWWKGVNLGQLNIESKKTVNGVNFKRIDVIDDNHQIKLSANWIKLNQGSMTKLYGNMSASHLGEFLSQLDITKDFEETTATVDLNAEWGGLPYQFSLKTLKGEAKILLEEGRISSIEPGFGRLLGLIAMDQWIKRLSLNFGDVYKKGLTFNNITGTFSFNEGKMLTNNLLVDAVPAHISLRGEVDFLAKTLDHKVKVVPKSSDAIPIAGTIVGEVAGVITKVLDKDYEEGYFFSSNYNMVGPWNNIEMIPLYEEDGILNKTWNGLTRISQDKVATE